MMNSWEFLAAVIDSMAWPTDGNPDHLDSSQTGTGNIAISQKVAVQGLRFQRGAEQARRSVPCIDPSDDVESSLPLDSDPRSAPIERAAVRRLNPFLVREFVGTRRSWKPRRQRRSLNPFLVREFVGTPFQAPILPSGFSLNPFLVREFVGTQINTGLIDLTLVS